MAVLLTNQGVDTRLGPLTAEQEEIIALSIAGKGLLLQGRFDHWVPIALDRTSAEKGVVQVLFDMTGTARAALGPGELFSFTARSVTRMGLQVYRANGTMTRGDVQDPVEAVIQSAPTHTPFVAVTFAIDRVRFPEVWTRLSERVPAEPDGAQLLPRAWIRIPVVATA